MDTVLENNGEVAIIRGKYEPLEFNQRFVFAYTPGGDSRLSIGLLWQICRSDVDMSSLDFLNKFPVGAQINISGEVKK